jgi:Cu(I)/Ag(I) efflux system membrane protein CusA/SilA
MKRIAAPIVGGLATSFLMELLVYPVLYEWWMSRNSDLRVPVSEQLSRTTPQLARV